MVIPIPAHQVIPTALEIDSPPGPIVTANGEEYLNFTSSNYLGLASLPIVVEEAQAALIKYGVGSCGPRGFYGTVDVHLQLEQTWSRFMKSVDSILYSDYIACLSSVIPAFSKAGDFIFADKECNIGIQQGLRLSRSKVTLFDHNDIASLETALQQNDATLSAEDKLIFRRFIVVEGVYDRTGHICPLKQITDLAARYKVRVIIDDTNAMGVLGSTGRGSFEHWNVPFDGDIHIICSSLGHTFSGVGAICIGDQRVVSHQRLSGLGYCYSAASPPYTAVVGTTCIGLLDANPELPRTLQTKLTEAFSIYQQKLRSSPYLVSGDKLSPITVLRIDPAQLNQWGVSDINDVALYETLSEITQILREQHHVIISQQHHGVQEDRYPFGLRLQTTILHSVEDITLVADLIAQVTQQVLQQRNARAGKAQTKCDVEQTAQ